MQHFLIARFTHRTPHSAVLCYNVFSLFFTSRASSVSNTNQHKDGSFTVPTLIKSCGLSAEKSLKLSKRLNMQKNPDGPKAVIELLRSYGFSETQLSILLKKHPFVVLSNPEKTLLPKLEFLKSIGVSTTDLPKILIGNTAFLTASLKKTIIPHYEVIKTIVLSDEKVVSTLKHATWYLNCGWVVNDSVKNTEALRMFGVPQRLITLFVSNFPGVAFMKHDSFVGVVKKVKEMGFEPSKSNFVLALQVVAKMNKATWKSRFKVFEKWGGWSRDTCVLAFRRYPQCMMISEKKLVKVLSFLGKDMGLTRPEDIARSPGILNRNLEKTLIPRFAVINILKSRGLIKSGLRLGSFIDLTEKMFLERYVARYQNDVPLLLDAYKGKKSD